jgi:hypothetical protein
MKRIINRILQEWSNHPRLPGLKRDGVRERMVNDIINNLRKNPAGNGWFLDLSPEYMRETANPEDR